MVITVADNRTALDAVSLQILIKQLPGLLLNILISAFGVFGNLSVIVTIVRNKTLHTRCFAILCNLAIAESINSCSQLCTNALNVYLYSNNEPATDTQLACVRRTYVTFAGSLCSQFLTLAVTCDRFAAVRFPLAYRNWLAQKAFHFVNVCSWLLSFGFCALIFWLNDSQRLMVACTPVVAPDDVVIDAYNYIQICVSILVLVFSSASAAVLIGRHRAAKSFRERQHIRHELDIASCRTICIVALVYLCTWVTTSVCHNILAKTYSPVQYLMNSSYCAALAVTYPASHLIVYLSTSSVFRIAFARAICNIQATSAVASVAPSRN